MTMPSDSLAAGGSTTRRLLRCAALLGAIALLLAAHGLAARLPIDRWAGVVGLGGGELAVSGPTRLTQLVLRYGWLPRMAMSVLAGAALSLAGVVFQQVLRNPLAEPLTLGVSAGAYLAMTLAAVFAPTMLVDARFSVALAGAAAAMVVTAALAWRKGLSTVSVVLAGMIVNLYCGAAAVLLTIMYERSLTSVFVWGGGALEQNGWSGAMWLAPRVVACGVGAACLVRPLTLFTLDDRQASQLGVSLAWVRPAALAVAVLLSAFVASAVGVIGFIGLGGPALARLLGARRLRDRLIWAPVLGALLLMLADQAVQTLPAYLGGQLPTGAGISLLGGPLLLWMLYRFRIEAGRPQAPEHAPARRSAWGVGLCLLALLALASGVSLRLGVSAPGWHAWHWASGTQWQEMREWRVPRLVASTAAGVMLALAGTLLQRATGNPMASPEMLGVSGGAMVGTLAAALVSATPAAGILFGGAAAGALLFLAILLTIAKRHRFAPGHTLLGGIALSAFSQAVIVLATVSGLSYTTLIQPLLYGSTYLIGSATAAGVAVAAVGMAVVCGLCGRWLDILPLGADVADALGVGSRRAALLALILAALLSAGATIVIGPMSFVGLMAPHLARLMGFARARAQMAIAALLGALLMVLADWLGRNLIFPQQMPAGVLATLIGGPYLMLLLRR